MKKLSFLVFSLFLSVAIFGGKIVYDVDPATASPQPVVVVKNAEGEVKVFFSVPTIEGGQVYLFKLDMYPSGSNIIFPVNCQMRVTGNKKEVEVSFTPSSFIFENNNSRMSSEVRLTLPYHDYSSIKKIKVKIKAKAEKNKGLGESSGVKVIIVKANTHQEFIEAINEELLNEKN